MKRKTRIKVAVAALIVAAVAFAVGCVQPFDATTGAKVGGVQSIFAPHPLTNPDTGNAIVVKAVKPTRDDVAQGVEVAGVVVQKDVAPLLPPPWNLILAGLAGVAVPVVASQLRKKKASQ